MLRDQSRFPYADQERRPQRGPGELAPQAHLEPLAARNCYMMALFEAIQEWRHRMILARGQNRSSDFAPR